jgi:hypothetical protein
VTRQPGAVVALAALAALSTLASCAGHPAPPKPSAPAATRAPLDAGVHRSHGDAQPLPHVHLLTTLDRRALGPFVARAGDDGLAAWIVGNARGPGQVLYVVPLGADGASLSPPVAAASLHDGATQLVVRPRGRPGGGWLVGWSSLLDRGEALSVLSVDTHGAPRADPVEIERTSDHLAWFDFSPGPRGTLCTWAEETSAATANVLAVGLGVDAKPVGVPARVAQGVARWAVLSGAAGTGLALADAGGKGASGRLTWATLDPDGHLQGTPVPIGSGPTVGSDIEGGAAGDGWLVAWTDRAGMESQVAVARLDSARRVEGPARPFESVGSSSLVGTASGPHGTLVAWESPRATAHPFRELHLSMVAGDKGLLAQPAGSMEIASKVTPELVATDDGYALLASARVCLAGKGTPGCTGPLAPTFVRFGSALEPLQTEPILLGESRAPAAIAWGLRCSSDRCTVLAATGDTPTEVYVVDLAQRASPFAAPLEAPPPADAPRVTSVRAVASGEAFVDVAAARLGNTTLLATLSLPQGSGEREARRAATAGGTAALRVLDVAGQPTGVPTIVSSRATPTGGIAIAPAARAEDGAAIAWVKPDGGVPQVHLAHVDKAGRRTREMQLTSSRVDTSTVSIATVDDGWLVAWVDGRHGSGEVYATKVDFRLDRSAKDERITSAPGDAADVMLAVPAGDDHPVAWLAWSDPRESPSEGLGDIYVTQIRARDAHRSADEVRVLATAAHSRSPRLIAFRDAANGPGAVVAWLEDAPAGLEGPAAVLVARLDATGHVMASPNRMPLPPDCRPSDVALGRDEARGAIRAIVSCGSGGAVTLDAARLGNDAAVTAGPTMLLDLEAPAAFETGLALVGDALFFTDYGGGPADHRVRRAVIDWR